MHASTTVAPSGEPRRGFLDGEQAAERPHDEPAAARTPARLLGRAHARLLVFFLGLALAGAAAGAALLARAALAGEPALVALDAARARLVAVVVAVAALGGLGVFLHRLRILPQRQREIDHYLERIQREAAKSQALLEGAVDMLLLLDPRDGAVLEGNALARGVLGEELFAGEAAGRSFPARLPPEDAARFRAALAGALEGREGQPDLLQLRVRDGAGQLFPADLRLVVVRIDREPIVELSLRDRSAQEELERRLRLHERLGSLGLLTASVAHEINNPLEGISNYLRLLARPDLTAEDRERYLERARHGLDRIAALTRDLLQVARPAPSRAALELADVARRGIELARYSKHCKEVEIVLDGDTGRTALVGDEKCLEQVVVNLLINAGKAMGGRGRVLVELRRDAGSPPCHELRVVDQGPGIDESQRERIFEPAFTTGDGIGLGLSISREIVEAHGGRLEARNRPEGGAELLVRLPGQRTERP